ncbi:MAG: hypothetical protein HY744_31395 [Deltaproteobacteria bacterium]|nr:hypothetical protein [Deltaproteobacteria bacterium]
MKKYLALGLAGLTFAAISVSTDDADAACGCVKDWKACVATAKKDHNPASTPGQSAKALKDRMKAFRACDKDFHKCVKQCGKECMDACNEAEQDAKKECAEAFEETLCPIKGNDAEACKKEAREQKKECKQAADDAQKACKKECKD